MPSCQLYGLYVYSIKFEHVRQILSVVCTPIYEVWYFVGLILLNFYAIAT